MARLSLFMPSIVWTLFNLVGLAEAQSSPYCHFLGPVFPRLSDPASEKTIQNALAQLSSSLNDLRDDGSFDTLETTLFITVFGKQQTFLDYGYSPSSMEKDLTAGSLDEDTIFRVGSVSKLLTVYSLLAKVGMEHIDDPVTKWVPELVPSNGNKTYQQGIQWSDITVGALASHLSGLPRGHSIADLVQGFEAQGFNDSMIEALGLPALPDKDKPQCGVYPDLLQVCSRKELLEAMTSIPAVSVPFQMPLYSNLAYDILGYAIEGITGQTWAENLQSSVLTPLGLSRTFPDAPLPNLDNVVIPGDELQSWINVELGPDAPGGGILSSASDLRRFGQSILNSTLLTSSMTRAWFKPQSQTYDLKMSVGLSWEIRSMLLPLATGSNYTRRVDIYSKDGGIGAYKSIMVFSPDHELGFAVLLASTNPQSGSFLGTLPELITQALVPAFEQTMREKAAQDYAGHYVDSKSGMSLVIEVDDEMPGLRIANWTKGDLDMLQSLASLRYGPGVEGRLTLYPTQVDSGSRVSFRGVWERATGSNLIQEDSVFLRGCSAWAAADAVKYGNIGIDDFEFIRDATNVVVGVSPRVTRKTLLKVV